MTTDTAAGIMAAAEGMTDAGMEAGTTTGGVVTEVGVAMTAGVPVSLRIEIGNGARVGSVIGYVCACACVCLWMRVANVRLPCFVSPGFCLGRHL
jgi:hypothetical protein